MKALNRWSFLQSVSEFYQSIKRIFALLCFFSVLWTLNASDRPPYKFFQSFWRLLAVHARNFLTFFGFFSAKLWWAIATPSLSLASSAQTWAFCDGKRVSLSSSPVSQVKSPLSSITLAKFIIVQLQPPSRPAPPPQLSRRHEIAHPGVSLNFVLCSGWLAGVQNSDKLKVFWLFLRLQLESSFVPRLLLLEVKQL